MALAWRWPSDIYGMCTEAGSVVLFIRVKKKKKKKKKTLSKEKTN
jgi:hypothetical protein